MDALAEFWRAPEDQQLAYVDSLPIVELRTLNDLYLEYVDRHALNVRCSVWARMLERIDPEEYLEAAQDAEIRRALKPAALRRMRDETYESQIRPLLQAEIPVQDKFVDSLDREDRGALLHLLDRYAREFGRSRCCRDLESRIRITIEGSR